MPDISKVFNDIDDEYCRARKLHTPMASAHEGYAVLKEEVDELWDDIKHNAPKSDMRVEAIQIAAMALAFVLEVTEVE